MKTLILNGSARESGNTAALLNKLLSSARGEIININAFASGISACTNCGSCDKGGCVLDDKMREVFAAAETADNVVIASPVYFGNLTPPLLAVLSRFQCRFSDFGKIPVFGKRKKGVIILTSGGGGVKGRAEADARMMLKMMNAEIVETVISEKTDKIQASGDTAALNKAEEAAKILFL